jgi:hypothetical protein
MKLIKYGKMLFVLVLVVMTFPFAVEAVSKETKGTEAIEIAKVIGVIEEIAPATRKVTLKSADKETITLTAVSEEVLADLSTGNSVMVEYTSDMVIKSITKLDKDKQ